MKKFIETLKNIWRIEDLRSRILITLGFAAIYRFGSFIVLPGINPEALTALRAQTDTGLMSLLNMFSGGAFSNASVFALGIMPYISASIVIQLFAFVVPYFQKMQREGESGRRKINQYTRYLTILILLFQAPFYLLNLRAQAAGALNPALDWNMFMIASTFILAAGSMFTLWVGERITDKGIGNGDRRGRRGADTVEHSVICATKICSADRAVVNDDSAGFITADETIGADIALNGYRDVLQGDGFTCSVDEKRRAGMQGNNGQFALTGGVFDHKIILNVDVDIAYSQLVTIQINGSGIFNCASDHFLPGAICQQLQCLIGSQGTEGVVKV